jgi:hypothetical protein
MKRAVIPWLTVLALVAGARANAHHSFAATYLEGQSVTIEAISSRSSFAIHTRSST